MGPTRRRLECMCRDPLWLKDGDCDSSSCAEDRRWWGGGGTLGLVTGHRPRCWGRNREGGSIWWCQSRSGRLAAAFFDIGDLVEGRKLPLCVPPLCCSVAGCAVSGHRARVGVYSDGSGCPASPHLSPPPWVAASSDTRAAAATNEKGRYEIDARRLVPSRYTSLGRRS
jgi:hypothetical protein